MTIVSESLGFILPLAAPEAILETVGGKGASLARLVMAGLPVPDGFHITTAAYRQVVAANDLQPRILAVLEKLDAAQPASLEMASQAIRALFAQADIPEEIAGAIAQAYMALPWDNPAVAVRSSATAEDLPDASFAGQQETFLNVQGVTAVLEAVKQCWASLWTARAISYRARQAIAPDQVSLAVVVQQLVPADAAGILFTVNPVNGRRQEAIISAAWGLGEAVVGGLVTPDALTVDKATGKVLDRQTADKAVMTVRVADGTEEQPVPKALRHAPVLSDQQAADLVRLGVQIEELYAMPMDIEWTLQDGSFAIVQARPVTALPSEAAEPAEIADWTVPDDGPYLHGGAFLEVLTEPVSTLFSTLGLKSSDEAMHDWLERYGLGDFMIYPLARAVNGYVYARVRYRLRPKHIPPYVGLIREHMRAIEVWWQEVARYRAFAKEAEKVNVTALSHSDLCRRIELLEKEATIYWLFVGEVIRPVISREEKFTNYYKRLAQPEDPEAQVLFRGGETLALQADRALYELVGIAQQQPEVAKILGESPAQALAQLAQLPQGEPFLQAFYRYLDKYGYQMYSFDPLLPTLGEDPQPALLALQAYLRGQESPDARVERMEAERMQVLARLEARLSARKYNRLCYLLRKAREAAQIREDAVFELGLAWRPLRRSLLELGQRLAEADVTANAEQLFWLRWDEILAAAADLDTGKTPEPLSTLAERRHKEWQTWQALQPPHVLPEDGKVPFWLKYATPLPELQEQVEDLLTGFAASPGKVTAVARVIHAPEEMDRLGQGEILVARTTTPAWTPIFARIAAVVTDLGGALSHSSIVAREYGIPAVTGTGFATQRIRDGQTITVDGTAGEVKLSLDGAASTAEPASADAWPLPDSKGQYLRGSAAELLPDPMSPLFETIGVAALDKGTRQLFAAITGLPMDQVAGVIYPINGYAFMSTKFTGKQWFLMLTRGSLAVYRLIKNGESHWRDEMHPRYAAALARWQSRPLTEMSAADLWAGAQELTLLGMKTYNSLQSGIIPASTTSETVFTKLYEKLIQGEGDPPALTFILGFNSLPIRAEKSLYDLGAWARSHEGLATYLQQTPTAQLVEALAAVEPPPALPVEVWSQFKIQFEAHLAQYGHTIYDLDFLKPTPADDPAPLLETLRVYVGGAGADPHRRQAALAEKREAAMATIRARHRRGLRRWLFEKTVGWAQNVIPLREEGLADLGLGWPRLRQMLLEIGRRGVAAGLMQQAEDIFWLRDNEVETAVSALDRGEKVESLATAVTERKALWQARKQVIPPSVLPPRSRYLGIDVEKWMPARIGQDDAEKITGVGASPGRITGTARVLHGPEAFGQMQPGDILVAAITTPAWTPLFALATAVVTDIGGPLSHSSIVAREYGIPAVLGTGVATKRIRSGQTITVDGGEGVILLAADA